jgi:hypothetical protein
LYITHDITLIKIIDFSVFLSCNLKTLLNGTKQNHHELIDILLLQTLSCFPPKALRQVTGAHIVLLGQLKSGKQLLQLIRNAKLFVSMNFRIVLPLVHKFTEFRSHVQSLKITIQVASGSLVTKADVIFSPFFTLELLNGLVYFVQVISMQVCMLSRLG